MIVENISNTSDTETERSKLTGEGVGWVAWVGCCFCSYMFFCLPTTRFVAVFCLCLLKGIGLLFIVFGGVFGFCCFLARGWCCF